MGSGAGGGGEFLFCFFLFLGGGAQKRDCNKQLSFPKSH